MDLNHLLMYFLMLLFLARQMSAEEYLRKQEADRRLAEELSQQWMAEDELGAAEREMDRLRREVAESAGAFLWEFEGEEGCKIAMRSRFGRSRTRSRASLLQGSTTIRSSGAC